MNPVMAELVQPSPDSVHAGDKHEEERKDTVSPLWRPDPERMEAPDTVTSSDSAGSPSQGQPSGQQHSSPTSSSQDSSKSHFWSNYNETSIAISNGVKDIIADSAENTLNRSLSTNGLMLLATAAEVGSKFWKKQQIRRHEEEVQSLRQQQENMSNRNDMINDSPDMNASCQVANNRLDHHEKKSDSETASECWNSNGLDDSYSSESFRNSIDNIVSSLNGDENQPPPMPMSFDHDESFSSDDFRGNINNIVNGLNESCGMSENALKPATMKSPPRPIVTSPLIDVVERTSSPMSALSAPVSSNGYHPDLEDITSEEEGFNGAQPTLRNASSWPETEPISSDEDTFRPEADKTMKKSRNKKFTAIKKKQKFYNPEHEVSRLGKNENQMVNKKTIYEDVSDNELDCGPPAEPPASEASTHNSEVEEILEHALSPSRMAMKQTVPNPPNPYKGLSPFKPLGPMHVPDTQELSDVSDTEEGSVMRQDEPLDLSQPSGRGVQRLPQRIPVVIPLMTKQTRWDEDQMSKLTVMEHEIVNGENASSENVGHNQLPQAIPDEKRLLNLSYTESIEYTPTSPMLDCPIQGLHEVKCEFPNPGRSCSIGTEAVENHSETEEGSPDNQVGPEEERFAHHFEQEERPPIRVNKNILKSPVPDENKLPSHEDDKRSESSVEEPDDPDKSALLDSLVEEVEAGQSDKGDVVKKVYRNPYDSDSDIDVETVSDEEADIEGAEKFVDGWLKENGIEVDEDEKPIYENGAGDDLGGWEEEEPNQYENNIDVPNMDPEPYSEDEEEVEVDGGFPEIRAQQLDHDIGFNMDVESNWLYFNLQRLPPDQHMAFIARLNDVRVRHGYVPEAHAWHWMPPSVREGAFRVRRRIDFEKASRFRGFVLDVKKDIEAKKIGGKRRKGGLSRFGSQAKRMKVCA